MTMNCDRCHKPINPAVHGRWSLPCPSGGVETVCEKCVRLPAPLRLEPRGGIVLIDKDGNEYPIDGPHTPTGGG